VEDLSLEPSAALWLPALELQGDRPRQDRTLGTFPATRSVDGDPARRDRSPSLGGGVIGPRSATIEYGITPGAGVWSPTVREQAVWPRDLGNDYRGVARAVGTSL